VRPVHAGRSHVLIVSSGVDEATDVVSKTLTARGATVTRLNTEQFPFSDTWTSRISTKGREFRSLVQTSDSPAVDLGTVGSIWYRRVRVPPRPDAMNPGVYDYCLRESRATLLGGLLAQSGRIMSAPEAIWRAEHKLLQLSVALLAGLSVPDTVVTNDPREVREAFARFNGQMIGKPVRSGYVDLGQEQMAIFTSQILAEHLALVDRAQVSPVIYQRLIPKEYDIRVTIVGDKMFVAEIDSQSDPDASIDWRRTTNPSLPHRRGTLPEGVRDALYRLMNSLGLAFGAIDLVRTPDGAYVFLEINPNGQWLWLDDFLDLGISDAVSNWLLS